MARTGKKQSKSSKSPASRAPSVSSRQSRPFPYIALHGGSVRPALPIIIHTPRTTLAVRALVDSGADYSIFPKSYASYLGVNLAEAREEPCITAGGRGTVLVHPQPLEAEVQAMAVRFAMTSAFTEHANSVLLGRADFFRTFRVTFDQPAETFTLELL